MQKELQTIQHKLKYWETKKRIVRATLLCEGYTKQASKYVMLVFTHRWVSHQFSHGRGICKPQELSRCALKSTIMKLLPDNDKRPDRDTSTQITNFMVEAKESATNAFARHTSPELILAKRRYTLGMRRFA